MKTILLGFAIVICSMSAAGDPDDEDPDGRLILQSVIAALPRERLDISGDLTVRRRRGIEVSRHQFDMMLDWGAHPSLAEYTVRDGFGAALSRLVVERPAEGDRRISFFMGDPPVRADTPALDTRVQDTDLTWTDLTLSWLWWDDAEFVGTDSVKGRDCDVVDVATPAPAPSQPEPRCDHVRIWVDQEMSMVLKAEGRNAGGDPLRTMWVKSFKKIDGRWMIKDLEVQTHPAAHRTKLRVREVKGAS